MRALQVARKPRQTALLLYFQGCECAGLSSMQRRKPAPIENVTASSHSSAPIDLSLEQHYSVSLSERTIRRMFEDEPDVFKYGQGERRFKRGYTTWRIPESVVLRAHRKQRKAS